MPKLGFLGSLSRMDVVLARPHCPAPSYWDCTCVTLPGAPKCKPKVEKVGLDLSLPLNVVLFVGVASMAFGAYRHFSSGRGVRQ